MWRNKQRGWTEGCTCQASSRMHHRKPTPNNQAVPSQTSLYASFQGKNWSWLCWRIIQSLLTRKLHRGPTKNNMFLKFRTKTVAWLFHAAWNLPFYVIELANLGRSLWIDHCLVYQNNRKSSLYPRFAHMSAKTMLHYHMPEITARTELTWTGSAGGWPLGREGVVG